MERTGGPRPGGSKIEGVRGKEITAGTAVTWASVNCRQTVTGASADSIWPLANEQIEQTSAWELA